MEFAGDSLKKVTEDGAAVASPLVMSWCITVSTYLGVLIQEINFGYRAAVNRTYQRNKK